jgi:hypothetical protein
MDDDYEPIPYEVLRALPSDPFMYALKEAYAQRMIKKAKENAAFIAANPRLFRSNKQV